MIFAFQFQSPGPIIFELGPIVLRWYGLLIATAVLLGVTLSQYLATLTQRPNAFGRPLAKARRVDPELLGDLAIWLVIGAIPCARLYYVAFQWQQYVQRPWWHMLAVWEGGIAIHGAIIGGTIATIIFARVNRISLWQLLDLVAPSLILGQAIGRWGNFFNSEAFGKPTDLPWKLYIAPQYRPFKLIDSEYFHPTFLYESFWNIGVFALLLWLFFWGLQRVQRSNQLKIGTIAAVYLIGYSLGRVWIEWLRTDSLMIGPLKIAQVVSLGAIALGLSILAWLYILKKPLPDVVSRADSQKPANYKQ